LLLAKSAIRANTLKRVICFQLKKSCCAGGSSCWAIFYSLAKSKSTWQIRQVPLEPDYILFIQRFLFL